MSAKTCETVECDEKRRAFVAFSSILAILCTFSLNLEGCKSTEKSTAPKSNEYTVKSGEKTAQPIEKKRLVDNKTKYVISVDVSKIPSLLAVNGVTVDLIEVGPWVNQMPVSDGPESETAEAKAQREARNRHLVATAVLRNGAEDELQVELLAAFISFDAGAVGQPVAEGGLTLIDETGMPSGEVKTVLEASKPKRIVRFRGSGLYREGHQNQILYLTLILQIGDNIFRVRRGGNVVLAM